MRSNLLKECDVHTLLRLQAVVLDTPGLEAAMIGTHVHGFTFADDYMQETFGCWIKRQ